MQSRRQQAADALRDRMEALGLTIRDVADQAGIHENTLGNMLAGQSWPRERARTAIETAVRWERGTLTKLAYANEPEIGSAQTVAGFMVMLLPGWDDELDEFQKAEVKARTAGFTFKLLREIREQGNLPPLEQVADLSARYVRTAPATLDLRESTHDGV